MPQTGKSFGNVKVKQIPDDCGYMKKFRYNIDMNSNGIMGDCISWCQVNCEGKWGWWFEKKHMSVGLVFYEEQNAYMSFEKKKDATRFWMSVGIQNMGQR